jgi:hypothetical protein
MGRFLFWTVIFLIAGGLALHYNIYLPWFSSWLGHLPGDTIVKTKQVIIYFPITSAAVISIVFSLILSAIFRK